MVLVDCTNSCHEIVILRQELPQKMQDKMIAPVVLKLSVESSILSQHWESSKLKSWKLSINRKIPPELNPWNAVSPGVLHQRCAKWRLLLFCPAKNHGALNLDWNCVLKWQISGSELKKSSTASSVWDSELQGFGKKLNFRGVFKTYRKIRGFLKRTQF